MQRRRDPRRPLLLLAIALGVSVIAYALWQPGATGPLPSGRRHGAWLTHAWWGDDLWFEGSARRPEDYRGEANVRRLSERMHRLGIRDWYVHASPSTGEGALPFLDEAQARRLVEANAGGDVLAWIGGVLHESARPADPAWRRRFVADSAGLVGRTGIRGVQLNIEPCPSFTPGYLELLEELRAALPPGARLSVVAFPPPHPLHPAPEVHWEEGFYRAVAARSDDLVIMAYDTGQRLDKVYTWMVARWTREALSWSGGRPVHIGIPAYEDVAGYHHPDVETPANALAGLAAGLGPEPPSTYAGWAVYAEWTLDAGDIQSLRRFQPDSPPR